MAYPNARACNYVKSNGTFCKSPAMRGHLFCFYHHEAELRQRRRLRLGGPKSSDLDFGTLEDPHAIQIGIADVLHRLADKLIDRPTATAMLYGLQLAMVNVRAVHFRYGGMDRVVSEIRHPDAIDRFDEMTTENTKAGPDVLDRRTQPPALPTDDHEILYRDLTEEPAHEANPAPEAKPAPAASSNVGAPPVPDVRKSGEVPDATSNLDSHATTKELNEPAPEVSRSASSSKRPNHRKPAASIKPTDPMPPDLRRIIFGVPESRQMQARADEADFAT